MFENLPEILASIITFILGFGAIYLAKVRPYLKLLKEGADVFVALDEALADDQVTPEEIRIIMKEGKEAIAAFKALKKP